MIAILCPTRARPTQCKRMIESVCRTKSDQSWIHIRTARPSTYEDGYKIGDMCQKGEPCHNKKVFIDQLHIPEWPTCYTWNILANDEMKKPENRLFMLGADDMIFTTPLWDKALLDHYNALKNKIHVYHLRDSRNSSGTPHPIVTREYIEAMGYFLPPIFLHWFVDTWTVEIAKANNCFTHMTDFELVHDKCNDKGQPDETHSRIRDMGWLERDHYVNEHCKHFMEVEKQRLAFMIRKSA